MRKFIYALTLVLILFTIGAISEESEKAQELTDKQKLISAIILDGSGYLEAKWTNSYTIEATVDPEYFGNISESQAEKSAKLIADHGYKILDNNICVKIIDPYRGELAYTCKGNTPS